MKYIKYFIIKLTLIAINICASDARYYELKAKYKNKNITAQEEQELAPMAAARRIKKYITDPNNDPALIALHLSTVLGHPLYKELFTVQVGNRIYQKCYLAAHAKSPSITTWTVQESDQR